MKNTKTTFFIIVLVALLGTTKAQLYSSDLINASKCTNYSSFGNIMQTAKFTPWDAQTKPGVQEAYMNTVVDEDGTQDYCSIAIQNDNVTVALGTNRYYTFDAMLQGLRTNAFELDTTFTKTDGTIVKQYLSSLVHHTLMFTKTLPEAAGLKKKYYVGLTRYF